VDILSIITQLGNGMIATASIFFFTLLFSLPLGLLVCFGRMSEASPFGFLARKAKEDSSLSTAKRRLYQKLGNFKPLQLFIKIYISIMRGTPLMLQLFVVFYAPYYVFGISISASYRLYAVLIGFSLNYAAYFAEIFRAGIQAVPVGHYEAASVLGYSKSQTFAKIVFPQMVKHVVPPVTNEVITLVKDTSLAFAIAYQEMFTTAKQIAAAETTIIPLFVAGVFYYIFNLVVAYGMERIEKKLNYYH